MIFLPILIFALGLIIGSFLNVVIIRLNTGWSIVSGRSKCDRCNKTLTWYELIPVFSFLGLRGKCKDCRAPISFQNPVIELTTAIVFIILYTKVFLVGGFSLLSLVSFLGSALIACLLIVILVYDFKHKIIPNKIVYPFIIFSLISIFWKAIFIPGFTVIPFLVAGPVFASPFFFIWLFSRGSAMGFGDVKLALGMGFVVGLSASLATFLLSFWIGAIFGLFLIALSRASLKSQVPFAPFMILAFFIVTTWGVTIGNLFPLW